MKRLTASLRVLIAAGVLLAPPAIASAASASFSASLSVPMACFVGGSGGPLVVTDGQTTTGSVVEACNEPGGYTVIADYRPLNDGEQAQLQYGENAISLPASGEVIVHVSNMATVKQIAYTLQSTHLDAPLEISLNIQPV